MTRTMLPLAAFAFMLAVAAPAAAADAPASPTAATGSQPALELFQAKKYKEAIAFLDTYIATHPTDAIALTLRGDSKANLDDDKGALADYDAAIAADPKYAYAWATRCETRYNDSNPAALDDCNTAITLAPNDTYAYVTRGDIYFDKADYKSALGDYSKAIDLGRPGAYAWAARCNTKRILNDFAGAASDCAKAQSIQADSRTLLWAQGRLAIATNRWADAVTAFTAHIAKDPKSSDFSYYFRALANNRLKHYALAMADLKIYIAHAPQDGDGYRERAVARYGTGDKAGAKADLETALQLYHRDGNTDGTSLVVRMQDALDAGTSIILP
jgi:tetratricopeptide (TPR) repeat protein